MCDIVSVPAVVLYVRQREAAGQVSLVGPVATCRRLLSEPETLAEKVRRSSGLLSSLH